MEDYVDIDVELDEDSLKIIEIVAEAENITQDEALVLLTKYGIKYINKYGFTMPTMIEYFKEAK